MTMTDEWGWSATGFDPEKIKQPWRQVLVDACQFVSECAHQGDEAARLADMADLWLAKLHKHPTGFIPSSQDDMAMLAEVVDDYADYESNMGRYDPNIVSAQVVLKRLHHPMAVR